MTEAERKADRALIDAATPGVWRPERHDCDSGDILYQVWSAQSEQVTFCVDDGSTNNARTDANFIAAARTRWPAALDEVERLNQKLKHESGLLVRANGVIAASDTITMERWAAWQKAYMGNSELLALNPSEPD